VKELERPEGKVGRFWQNATIYEKIMDVLKSGYSGRKELTTNEVAEALGRKPSYIGSYLFEIRKFTGALDYRRETFHRTEGLDEFEKNQYVQVMISKTASKKTRGHRLRRNWNYICWLRDNGHFPDATALIDDVKRKGGDQEERRFRHLDLLTSYVNSFKGSRGYKDAIVVAVKALYAKNRCELPSEKVVFNREMIDNSGTARASSFVRPAEYWTIIEDGRTPIRDKAIMAICATLGLDESTFVECFNYYAWPQILKQLGGSDPEFWDLSRAPIRIDMTRSKTQYDYFNFLPAKALKCLQRWIPVRKQIMLSDIKVRNVNGRLISDPIFITNIRTPITEKNVNKTVRESSFRSGVQEHVPGTRIYRIHAHEFRDTFKTSARVAGVDGPVADFFIGHNIDDEGYDKTPWTSPEHFRDQYLKVEALICNEERVSHSMEKKIQELESKLKNQTQVDKDLAEMREQQKDYAFLKELTWLKDPAFMEKLKRIEEGKFA
jgi:hypothetical protein